MIAFSFILECNINLSVYFSGRDPLCPYPSYVTTFFPHEKNCHQYYECYAGYKYKMSCFYTLFWNQTATTCDYLCGNYQLYNKL